MPSTRIDLQPFQLGRSLGGHRFGAFDPTSSLSATSFVKCFAGPEGPVRATVEAAPGGLELTVEGPGAEAVLEGWASRMSHDDGHGSFAPELPLLRRLHRGLGGMRLVPVPWLFDVACRAVLEQRVTWRDALQGWTGLIRAHGERSPAGVSFPSPAKVAGLPQWELQRLGIDPKRARTLIALARLELRRPLAAVPPTELEARLLAVPGVGPWTAGMILGLGAGDPDAVMPGDVHLPHLFTWALAGEPFGTDERMLELLEPYRGHRYRVLRLLTASRIAVPRGPERLRGPHIR